MHPSVREFIEDSKCYIISDSKNALKHDYTDFDGEFMLISYQHIKKLPNDIQIVDLTICSSDL